MPQIDSQYAQRDVVATDRGRGVVAAVVAADSEFPHGDDDLTEVSSSDDQSAYVVGLESTADAGDGNGVDDGASAVYRASDLEDADLEDDDAPEETDGVGPVPDPVSEDVDALDDLPDGWDRESVLIRTVVPIFDRTNG